MYKPKDRFTPPLFPELFPLGGELNPQNRWLRLAAAVPWQRLEEVYGAHFADSGRNAKDARLVCGLLIIKWLEGISDEKAVQLFNESPYVQAFCGFESFAVEDNIVNPSLLSKTRRNMGDALYQLFDGEIMPALKTDAGLRACFPRSKSIKKSFFEKVAQFLRGFAGE